MKRDCDYPRDSSLRSVRARLDPVDQEAVAKLAERYSKLPGVRCFFRRNSTDGTMLLVMQADQQRRMLAKYGMTIVAWGMDAT